MWDLLLRSVPSFGTLFRHALIAVGDVAPPGRREAVEALARRVGFDLSAIHQALDVREHKADRKNMIINDLAARYLAAIEKVTAAVDAALDSDASGRHSDSRDRVTFRFSRRTYGQGFDRSHRNSGPGCWWSAWLSSGSMSSVKNTLVTKNEAVKAAWSQVDIVLQRRADLIPNLVETVKGYAQQEETVFGDIAKARSRCSQRERRRKRSPPTGNWMAQSDACCWSWKIIRN